MPDEVKLPMVTVVIPCHNHAKWVGEAIESVANQDYPRKQIVVVDDGSTDDSANVVLRRLYKPTKNKDNVYFGKLLSHDTRVMMTRFDPAMGPAGARNQGIRLAWDYTDLFSFLDADDVYLPTKLSKSVNRWLEDREKIGVVYSDYDTLSITSGMRLRQFKEPFSRARLVKECVINCDSLVSKIALGACGVFDDSLRVCEDYDLWMRISERFVCIHIPEPLVLIRVGEHSSSSTVPSETWKKCYARVFNKAKQRMQQR